MLIDEWAPTYVLMVITINSSFLNGCIHFNYSFIILNKLKTLPTISNQLSFNLMSLYVKEGIQGKKKYTGIPNTQLLLHNRT